MQIPLLHTSKLSWLGRINTSVPMGKVRNHNPLFRDYWVGLCITFKLFAVSWYFSAGRGGSERAIRLCFIDNPSFLCNMLSVSFNCKRPKAGVRDFLKDKSEWNTHFRYMASVLKAPAWQLLPLCNWRQTHSLRWDKQRARASPMAEPWLPSGSSGFSWILSTIAVAFGPPL